MRSQSDYNETRAQIVARNSVYSDLALSSVLHPLYRDLMPVTDIDAVKGSIKNLILTNSYERPFQPDLTGKIGELLFENFGQFTAIEIEERIKTLISKHEPRVQDVSVTASAEDDTNSYFVSIRFKVINNQEAELTLYLARIR